MSDSSMQDLWASSHLSGGSMSYVDALYEDYLADPSSVTDEWQAYFNSLPTINGTDKEISHQAIRDYFLQQAKLGLKLSPAVNDPAAMHQANAYKLLNAYRMHGHHHADLDPLHIAERKSIRELDVVSSGFSQQDSEVQLEVDAPISDKPISLRELEAALKQTYCGSLGIEYLHIMDNEEVSWLQQRVESVRSQPNFTVDEKKKILHDLTAAEGLEKYLGSKYVGQKRFSLEGGDSLIPMMQGLIQRAGDHSVRELIIGMAHRGRLNVLINVLGKAPEELFQEFEGKRNQSMSGDVKYHMGFSSDVKSAHGAVHLALSFNPSHLEIISPVVQGSVRSRQRRRDDLEEKKQVVPLVIHGDAAFAGQGVVMETFNFSQARGYSVGGMIHVVINNQVGFTTSNPLDSRSTLYCTDVAKMVQAPILHVNGDDPEMVMFAMQIAFDFRMKFKRDVVIDLVCYRRHGHNEADEPSVTQPQMYNIIKALKTTRHLYADNLIEQGIVTQDEVDAMVMGYRDTLDKGDTLVETVSGDYDGRMVIDWTPYLGAEWDDAVDTTVTPEKLKFYASRLQMLPQDFSIHPVVKRLLSERKKMTDGELALNWGCAETLAYASLVDEGHGVRLSGQDCGRGTFAHRHAAIHDLKTAETYVPLEHISEHQKSFIVIDSVLSEEAVLGFEYGFSAAEPNTLVIWEAQFGDFVNGAQVVIDQFISSGEQKWGRLCGLVMYLPHGFEGQGPEHSSARLERFMQLCAQNNMQVCVPTTPAQIFHLIRRQMVRNYRKPLIVMTPKSLLRHKLAVSPLSDLSEGKFHNVIPEVDDLPVNKVARIIMCSGKVYYDLLQARRDNEQDNVAIVRLEQLYPFPAKELVEQLKRYPNATQVVWCQEEPRNQGAWFSSQHHMERCLLKNQTLSYAGRDFFAAPAVGSAGLHTQQQNQLVEDALTL